MRWTLLLLAVLLAPAPGVARDTHVPDIEAPEPWGFFAAPFDSVASVEFLPVVEINLEVERAWKVGMDWPARALDVALRAVGPLDARQIRIRSDRPGEDGMRTWVSIIQYGFLDDSVAGERHDLDLLLQLDGAWRVRAHERSRACYRSVGPVWIGEPCP
ncbi:MAG TPA: hypothetical protein VKA86_15230 [Candidatus Krumholzibacteria bacterium]|nr:hypothetical protein [Candidatus Krumholzibacteria bacterium]